MNAMLKAAAYQMIDLCTAGRGIRRTIGGESIRFPARWSRWYRSDYEPNTFAFLRRYCAPGSVAMDIGAHLGLFTVVMSRLVGPQGRVFTFEPTPLSRRVLSDVVHLNACDQNVNVRGEAVADRTGEATFYDTGNIASNANSLVCTQRTQGNITIATISLDDLVASERATIGSRAITCLKVDVEGAELNLLAGAQQTVRNDRPAIALSVHPESIADGGRSLSELWAMIDDLRYDAHFLESYGTAKTKVAGVDMDWFCAQNDMFDVGLLPRS
ncbi:MAG TPA: FkbM family methyltransferase [Pirellulales bacterium]|nr:FkbM family methyltransferase [Pirellulales bacterium]